MTKAAYDQIAEGLNEALAAVQRRQEPVGDSWLADFRRLFSEEFPPSECEAQKAVEGVGHQRVLGNRFSGEGA